MPGRHVRRDKAQYGHSGAFRVRGQSCEGGSAGLSRSKKRNSSLTFCLLVAIIPASVLSVVMITLLAESSGSLYMQRRSQATHPSRENIELLKATSGNGWLLQQEEKDEEHLRPQVETDRPPGRLQLGRASSANDSNVMLEPAVKSSGQWHANVQSHHVRTEDAASCVKSPPLDDGPSSLTADVTLVTQASQDRVWMVPHICDRWGGKMIVVALLRPDAPVHWPPANGHIETQMDGGQQTQQPPPRTCMLRQLELVARAGDDEQVSYPINRLRNAGIACVETTHYFVLDVDFWPSEELLSLLRVQLSTWKVDAPPLALVIPNFQRSGHGCRNAEDVHACQRAFDRGEIAVPANFLGLRSCIDARDCVVFDGEYNPQGQASTDVRAWMQLAGGSTRQIPCITSDRYEPFVVLRRATTTPLFDERFTGYGKNKVELLVHLRHAGYEFRVLGRAFVIHFPHQRSASKHHWLHSSAHRSVDRLFSSFTKEVAARYAGTLPRTPICTSGKQGAHQAARKRSTIVSQNLSLRSAPQSVQNTLY